MSDKQACCAPAQAGLGVTDLPSAVDFATERRPHISVNVKSIKASVPFYRALFNRPPDKMKADFAKWEGDNPPMNVTINEHPDSVDRDGHFGIEVKSTEAVHAYYERMKRVSTGIQATEKDVACCFAVQTKIWAADPDGNRWEVFVVTDGEADEGCEASCLCYNPQTGGCEWS
ncbi:MAG: ArsI/CadI family heavy metal resistance metalloenzyme [Aquisalimonadaceae bacterium]